MNYVINPMEFDDLNSFLDEKAKKIIEYFILKSLIAQPESIVGQKSLPIQVPKEHIEQWFTQALNVKPIGSGSYPIDIYSESKKWGADLKMLNMDINIDGKPSDTTSGEASLGQKFIGTGKSLDTLFEQKAYVQIMNSWLNLYKEKIKKASTDYKLKDIIYFFVLRPNLSSNNEASFYLCGARLDINKINKVEIDRATETSLFLKNFIDTNYGNTKIYKSKKRLELRLRPKFWIDNNKAIKITTTFNPKNINLRDTMVDFNFIQKRIDDISKTKVTFD